MTNETASLLLREEVLYPDPVTVFDDFGDPLLVVTLVAENADRTGFLRRRSGFGGLAHVRVSSEKGQKDFQAKPGRITRNWPVRPDVALALQLDAGEVCSLFSVESLTPCETSRPFLSCL
jgi:hypothetical protein